MKGKNSFVHLSFIGGRLILMELTFSSFLVFAIYLWGESELNSEKGLE